MPNAKPATQTRTTHVKHDDEWTTKLDDLRAQRRPPMQKSPYLKQLVEDEWERVFGMGRKGKARK